MASEATLNGIGVPDKAGWYCAAGGPNGKLDIVSVAGFPKRNPNGSPGRARGHLCWDGCIRPNLVLTGKGAWNTARFAMIYARLKLV